MKPLRTEIHKIAMLILTGFVVAGSVCRAQVPDDINGRLYRLCKTWGYVKYFNQNKCFRYWDTYLVTAIDDVLAAGNNSEFNSAIMKMLNQAGNNTVVENPPASPDTNLLFNPDWTHDSWFSAEVRSFLETFTSNIHPERSNCLVRFNNGASSRAYGWLDFTQDTIHMPINFTLASHRLTTVFYYWNVINYYFPYRNLTDESWDATLLKYIPQFRKPMTDLEFHKMFLKLVSHINDSHGISGSSLLTTSFWHGTFKPKIYFERIEDQCVVKKVDDIEGVLPGDILQTVNGRTVGELEDSLGQFISASNPAVYYREIYSNMILGGQDTEMELTLTDKQSRTYTVIATRQLDSTPWHYWKRETENDDPFSITSCGYGYVNMGKLQPDDVPAMYEALKNAPAIIFDIRNYPNGTISSLVPYFFSGPFTSARFHIPALYMNYTGTILNYLPGWYYTETNTDNFGSFSNPSPYPGKIYILVNQETQSHAEYTCQVLSYHPNAKVIGTQTAGADGNVTRIFLPGGIATLFTSLGWYYADGYQQQRNGVKIDSIVLPTIAGIREGKDEILLAALDCISGIRQSDHAFFSMNVYPNPATGSNVRISIHLKQPGSLMFILADIAGKTVRTWEASYQAGEQTETINLSDIAPGIYFLKVTNEGNALTRKIMVN